MSRFESTYLIRETHIDIFGHVNNATYLQIFEESRWDYLTAHGYGLTQIQHFKKGPVMLECRIRFLKELHARDEIILTLENATTESKAQQKVFQLRQQMIDSQGELACDAVFSYGLFDIHTRRLIEPTYEWKMAMGI